MESIRKLPVAEQDREAPKQDMLNEAGDGNLLQDVPGKRELPGVAISGICERGSGCCRECAGHVHLHCLSFDMLTMFLIVLLPLHAMYTKLAIVICTDTSTYHAANRCPSIIKHWLSKCRVTVLYTEYLQPFASTRDCISAWHMYFVTWGYSRHRLGHPATTIKKISRRLSQFQS